MVEILASGYIMTDIIALSFFLLLYYATLKVWRFLVLKPMVWD